MTIGLDTCNIPVFIVVEITHRAVSATTIDIMDNGRFDGLRGILNRNAGITLDKTEPHIVSTAKATAIDIAIHSTTKTCSTDGTATDGNMSVAADL